MRLPPGLCLGPRWGLTAPRIPLGRRWSHPCRGPYRIAGLHGPDTPRSSTARMGPMLSQIGSMWIPYLNPYGAHAKVICKTHKGPIYGSTYGTHPMLSQIGPISEPMWALSQIICKTHKNPIYCSPYGTHVVPDMSHVGPVCEPMWYSCQCHLQNPFGSHNVNPYRPHTEVPHTMLAG